jgi:hypothetical protein
MKYLEGTTVTLQATFRDIDGDLVAPSAVVLVVEDPDGDQTTPTTTNPSVGVYQAQIDLTVEGWWTFQFTGTTSEGDAVCEGRICAMASSLVGTS